MFFIYCMFGFEKSWIRSIRKFSSFIEEKLTNKYNYDWYYTYESFGTESCIRVYDIDQDGLDDLIFGLVGNGEINRIGNNSNQNKDLLMALRGKDGKQLWNITTKSEVFEINCLIDLDLDGRLDCIGSGRNHTLIGFDPHNGNVFWDQSLTVNLKDNWNIYKILILPFDYDQDGIREFLVSAGDNPMIPSNMHDRQSDRILLFSGKTGQKIGKDLILPGDKETFMSPILHSLNKQYYLLFGTGGETEAGKLYAQSLSNFYNYIIENDTYAESNQHFKKFTYVSNINGLYNIYKSNSKGIMVPPVLADVTNDGIKDILILSFDGEILMLNGLNFELIWKIKFQCHETYTTPSPGYFDDDDVLDFMLIQNLGTFDHYLNSSVVVLNGADGSILWKMNTGGMEMASPLTIRTKSDFRDIFFFRVQGLEELSYSNQQVHNDIEPKQPIDKSPNNRNQNVYEFCENLAKRNVSSDSLEPRCEVEKNSRYLSSYGLIVDRSCQENPIIVFETGPEEKMYNITLNRETTELCLVMEPIEKNTGVIGHFTSKDELDLITILTEGANVREPNTGNYIKIMTDLKIFKNNIRKSLIRSKRLSSKINKNLIVEKYKYNNNNNEINISELNFVQNQSWNAYIGKYADSSFD